MRFLHFVCHLGLGLALAGAGECARRYFALEVPIKGYESMAEPRSSAKAYEEIMAANPQADFAISIYRSQQETINILAKSHVDNLRAFQDSWRIQGILFAMLASLFGVAALRLGGSNKQFQPTQNASGVLRG